MVPSGDFNVVKKLDEVDGGSNYHRDVGMQDLKDCLTDIMVDDIHAFGPLFTWWNGQDNNPTHKKLDRALGNTEWFNSMPNATYWVCYP